MDNLRSTACRILAGCLLGLMCAAFVGTTAAQAGSGIVSVAANDETVTVTLGEAAGDDGTRTGHTELVALGVHQALTTDSPAVWAGTPSGQRVVLPRFDDAGNDRLFQRFVLRSREDERVLPWGPGRFADDLAGLNATGTHEPWPSGIKGIQAPLINEDMPALGVSHITDNISIASLIAGYAGPDDDPAFTYTVDGVAYAFDPDAVRHKDALYRTMHEYGINVVGIILCYRAQADSRYSPRFDDAEGQNGDGPLYHREADYDQMVQRITAVNLDTEEGQRAYRAVMGFLARRYTRSDNRYGRLGGYIIGNEVNSHWVWHHMGPATPEQVAQQYALQVRLSYYAVRVHDPRPRVFVSLDHFWNARHGEDPTHAMPGRELLERFAQQMKQAGDLPWALAHHPYPEDLFDPAFWEDGTAWLAHDTPRITYRNIELLVDYMRRPGMRYRGEARPIILSEQGFHAGATEASERVQAAAYALAHVKLSRLEGIVAHILHRHTDHPHEGGLLLGVRACDAQGRPTRKRLMFDVFAAAGTDREAEVFAFALPVIGLADWDEAAPAAGPFPPTRE
ncbi:MAG: DUF5722 domain-containing protein [Phycisphaerales bacterium JB063]